VKGLGNELCGIFFFGSKQKDLSSWKIYKVINFVNKFYKALLEWQKEKTKKYPEKTKSEKKMKNIPSSRKNGFSSFPQLQSKNQFQWDGLVAKNQLELKEALIFLKEELLKFVMEILLEPKKILIKNLKSL
jgi:hypothetical protein